MAEFQEAESGKGADRPQLAAALAACRTRRAVLVIAKPDRPVRNARFLLSVGSPHGLLKTARQAREQRKSSVSTNLRFREASA